MGKTAHELLAAHKRERTADETLMFLPGIGAAEHKHRKAIRSAHTIAVAALSSGKLSQGIACNLWITLRDHAEASWLAPATLDEIAEAAKLCRILWQAIQIAERRDGIIP